MRRYLPEYLLQLLQRFLKQQNQVNQIHSFLIVTSHLLNTPVTPKWQTTLFYNALIRAHFYFKQAHNTFHLFTLMLTHNSHPNSHTFPCLLRAISSSPLLASLVGSSLHTQIVRRGLLFDPFIQTSLLCLYADISDSFSAHKVFEEIRSPCIVEFNAMLDALGKNGDMGSALLLFESMKIRDVVSWTSIINGFATNGNFVKAIQYFERMIWHQDAKPNEATYVSVLSLCSHLDNAGACNVGKQIHGYIIRNEVALSVFTGTALINLYGKSGLLENSIKVFSNMVFKQVCTWNAMISSLACNGREKTALKIFDMMKTNRIRPNEATYVGVLTACARGKLVDTGLKLFEEMSSTYKIVAVMEHYGCVVDILGRSGYIREAYEFMREMPFKADGSVIGALLGACKIHGEVELGNEVGKMLVELQGNQYVALSNINAGVERWVDAADLREAMIKSGIRKTKAHSLIHSN